jgi:DNA helicase-2/ATP-dependent DNA helicase PcrA
VGVEPLLDRAELLLGLNDAQSQAVTHAVGPVLVIAGAGSGKTRVLTRRIAYLIAEGSPPGSILAITFTNKAAMEMRERVSALVGDVGKGMWVSTFHSACLRILRAHGDALGYRPGFVIYDQSDSRRLVEFVLRDLGLDPKRFSARALQSMISSAKSEGLTPSALTLRKGGLYESKVAEVYGSYQQRLVDSNALDFDDLLLGAVQLFEQNPEVLSYYQRRFRHILVDEFQDTNVVQNRFVELLASGHQQVFVVGDADQSIYRFRGAHVGNINEFEDRFDAVTVVALEENFRSTQTILDAANALIGHNPRRHAKKLYSSKGEGDPITLYEAMDDRDEASYVASEIARSCARGDRSFSDIAVFFRTNSQSRLIEEQLGARGVPFRLIGGVPFFERAEVKDTLAYLKLVVNPDDEIAFRRVVNVPRRGIGDVSLSRLLGHTQHRSETLLEHVRASAPLVVAPRVANALEGFLGFLEDLRAMNDSGEPPSAILETIVDRSGYRPALRSEGSFESEARLENLDELLRYAHEYHDSQGFLEAVALYSSADVSADTSAVSLMTLHMAKGLEFPVVYLIGLEDGIFPHVRSLTDPQELQEERRLLYVGITRAMEELSLTYSRQRMGFGDLMYNPPSRFLEEIPSELLSSPRAPRSRTEMLANYVESSRSSKMAERSSDSFAWPDRQNRPAESRPNRDRLVVGCRVFHDKWGEGIVLEVTGSGQREEASIRFGEFGTKQLMVSLANLKRLRD